jgi:hypothetical protein
LQITCHELNLSRHLIIAAILMIFPVREQKQRPQKRGL